MIFDPKPTKYPFPEETDSHYLVVKKNRGIVFDSKYPYVDTSKKFQRKKWWTRLLLKTIVFPISHPKMGLKIKGKKNLKKHKNIISQGLITVSNHVNMWDYIAIMNALKKYQTYVLVWSKNVNGESGPLVRMVGGIPIPEDNLSASMVFKNSVENVLKDGKIVQIYSEGSMWEYYAPIRPFKLGAAFFACECDKPILPLAFSYRKPSWIRKHIFKQPAAITLTIGEPLFANKNLSRQEQEIDLTKRCHETISSLAGYKPNENIYEPIFDNSKRIDYYK